MADSTQPRSKIQIFTQKKTGKRLRNTLFTVTPTLEMMIMLNSGGKEAGNKASEGLGRLGAGNMAIGRINEASSPNREKLFREREYLPIVQISKPSKTDVKSMSDRDSDPTVPNWDTTNAPLDRFKQPRFHFARKKMPYKIPHSDIRTAEANAGSAEGQAAKAVGSVYDVEVKTRTGVLCEVLNDELFGVNGQQGYPTDEDALTWDHFHSLPQAFHDTNTYGGIDRNLSQNSWWKGNRYTTAFSGSFEDLINHSNYDLGLIALGLGVQMICVGKTLMKRAKAEAKAEGYQLVTGSIPDPEYGFKQEMVVIHAGKRKVYIYYDPAMDAIDTASGTNNALCMDPSTFTIAIPGDRNFRVSKPADQTLVEGGDEADTGTIETEILWCCEVPKGNAHYTNIA